MATFLLIRSFNMYKLQNDEAKKTIAIIKKGDIPINNKYIPLSEENTDYQEYLEWVAEGNTAEAADD